MRNKKRERESQTEREKGIWKQRTGTFPYWLPFQKSRRLAGWFLVDVQGQNCTKPGTPYKHQIIIIIRRKTGLKKKKNWLLGAASVTKIKWCLYVKPSRRWNEDRNSS